MPRDRPARAHAGDEVRDPAARLLPELGAGRGVVRGRVRLVEVLVGLERARDLLGQAVGDAVVGLRRVGRHGGRSDDDLGAVGAQQVDLLLAHLVRHHGDHAIALESRGDREARARVAGGRLDDRAAGPQLPLALGRLDHRDRRAVLDRAARVQVLDLGDELRGRGRHRCATGARAACCRSRRAASP